MNLLLLHCFLFGISAEFLNHLDDSSLPPYLRDIGWGKIEQQLDIDLRLSDAVHPIEYESFLNVSVLGFQRATQSKFEGHVVITLNITKPVEEIELHAIGMDFTFVGLFASNKNMENLNLGRFNVKRESITIPSSRIITPGENVYLMISYSGVARMDGCGLYESWNTKTPGREPYISLLTLNSPTHARKWMPCFDEPNKKATFKLTIEHPSELAAYANTNPTQIAERNNRRTTTTFERTVKLPSYVFAFAVNNQPVLSGNNSKFRVIGFNGEEVLKNVIAAEKILHGEQYATFFENVTYIPEKTDVLVVEDFQFSAMENPGLISFGIPPIHRLDVYLHELAHMYFGNLVTMESWEDIWLKEGFASLFGESMHPHSFERERRYSHYEIPLHSPIKYAFSTFVKNHFGSMRRVHYNKGSQFLRMIREYLGKETFDKAINMYLRTNEFGNANVNTFVSILSSCDIKTTTHLQEIMIDWINKAGTPLFTVTHSDENVTIQQRMIHSLSFEEELLEQKFWHTPLFVNINGENTTYVVGEHPLVIPLPQNATFSIVSDYADLYVIYLSNAKKLEENSEALEDWTITTLRLYHFGVIPLDAFIEKISPYMKHPIVRSILENYLDRVKETMEENSPEIWDNREHCLKFNASGLDFNDLLTAYLKKGDIRLLFCAEKVILRTEVEQWLYEIIISGSFKLRNSDLANFLELVEVIHPGLTMDFLIRQFYYSPDSYDLRARLHVILPAVCKDAKNLEKLRDLIRRHPKDMAEVSDVARLLLEKEYQRIGVKKLMIELAEALKNMLSRA